MQGLGRTQNLGQVAHINKAATQKTAGKRGRVGDPAGQEKTATLAVHTTIEDLTASIESRLDQKSQSAADTPKGVSADAPPSEFSRSFLDWLREALATSEDPPELAAPSNRDATTKDSRLDLNFGVEKLSYKNMWKVLKTVVKEIGDIREASSGQFFLGVSQRLDKATTLMEFGSLVDYLAGAAVVPSEDIPPDAAQSVAGQIVSDAAASLEIQATIVPEMALHLLDPAE